MNRAFLRLCLVFLGLIFASPTASAQSEVTQVIELESGWNLVSVQVVPSGPTLTPQGFRAALDFPTQLVEVWGYTASGDPSTPGTWKTYQPNIPGFPSDLVSMPQGFGYWVNVSQFTKCTLRGIPWAGSVSFGTGWNLVGFPGVAFASSEAQELGSVFGSNFNKISQVWEHGTSTGFTGYDLTSIPVAKNLVGVRPGHGYWVYATEPFALTSQPFVSMQADSDASPLQSDEPFSAVDSRFHGTNAPKYVNTLVRYAQPEDVPYDLNGNGIIDGPITQDTIRFPIGVDRATISIGNTGESTANWALENTVPWLFSAPADPKDPTNSVRAKNASGVVSTDIDSVTLYVDRTGLLPGTITGQTITVHAGDKSFPIYLILEIPSASGDWKGYASAARVNGKAIGLGKIDMFLNLFMNSESPSETGFRAVLNRDLSLLFPRDVFMNGVFFQGNDFSLTTNFQMDKGDRNAPPYDTFPAPGAFVDNPNDPRQDKDYNKDGKLDVVNPFPFSVQREVTLVGKLVNPDRMEGTYTESIGGMLPPPQKIFIEGTFQLDRQSTEPTKRSIFNQTATYNPVVSIGGSSGNSYRDQTIIVASNVNIQNVTITLNVEFPSSAISVTLFGPNGQSIPLHATGTPLAASTTFNLSDFNGINGVGNWTLRVAWDPTTGERGTWNGWSLNIAGLSTYKVTGVSSPGAHVVLTGSNVLRQTDTDGSGNFSFANLTESGYSVVLTKSGYNEERRTFLLSNQDVNLGTIPLTALTITVPTLVAAPPIGWEPLFVDFSLLIPLDDVPVGVTTTTWNFGDGSAPVSASSAPSIDYGYAGLVQSNGAIVVAGPSSISGVANSEVFALARLNPTGTLDTTLGGTGKVLYSLPMVGGFARAMAAQSDGKLLLAGYASNGTSNDFTLVRYNANGTLDSTFNGTGKVTTNFGAEDGGLGLAIQADGKVLVSGYFFNGSNNDFALARYNANGTLDTGFNTTGKVTTAVGSASDAGHSVAVQSDGRILVAGYAYVGGNTDFAVVRYNTNGTLDTSFNGTGKVTTAIGTLDDTAQSMVVQSDGKIVLAGYSHNGTDLDFALVRYTATGALDTEFGVGGKVATAIGTGSDAGYSVALQPDGKILVVGRAFIGATDDIALVRYNANGTLDPTFNGTGIATSPIGGGGDIGRSVVVQGDGKIVVTGSATTSGRTNEFAVLRYNANGSFDPSFGLSGIVSIPAGSLNGILPTRAGHTYTTPGHFTATAVVKSGATTLISTQVDVHSLRTRPDAAGQLFQVVGGGFVGGFAAPLSNANIIETTPSAFAPTVNQVITVPAVGGGTTNVTFTGIKNSAVFQESKRDIAAFDIDRHILIGAQDSMLASPPYKTTAQPWPLAPFRLNAEDTDFLGVETGFAGDSQYRIYQQPHVLGVEVPDRWRVITTFGGEVFNETPSRGGNFIFQPGRIQR